MPPLGKNAGRRAGPGGPRAVAAAALPLAGALAGALAGGPPSARGVGEGTRAGPREGHAGPPDPNPIRRRCFWDLPRRQGLPGSATMPVNRCGRPPIRRESRTGLRARRSAPDRPGTGAPARTTNTRVPELGMRAVANPEEPPRAVPDAPGGEAAPATAGSRAGAPAPRRPQRRPFGRPLARIRAAVSGPAVAAGRQPGSTSRDGAAPAAGRVPRDRASAHPPRRSSVREGTWKPRSFAKSTDEPSPPAA